jgi:hypothetical protein
LDPRARLTDLRNGLLHLHAALLKSERHFYERDIERIPSNGRFLELLLSDPAFAWLRELSQMVVVIDELLEREEPADSAEADTLVTSARRLLTPAQTGATFETRYLEALQRDPDVVIAHSAMLDVLRSVEPSRF